MRRPPQQLQMHHNHATPQKKVCKTMPVVCIKIRPNLREVSPRSPFKNLWGTKVEILWRTQQANQLISTFQTTMTNKMFINSRKTRQTSMKTPPMQMTNFTSYSKKWSSFRRIKSRIAMMTTMKIGTCLRVRIKPGNPSFQIHNNRTGARIMFKRHHHPMLQVNKWNSRQIIMTLWHKSRLRM